jgi:hypothetical protein
VRYVSCVISRFVLSLSYLHTRSVDVLLRWRRRF